MTYEIRSSDGTLVASVSDGTLDQTSTSIGFIGRRYADFGLVFNENSFHLLENFANQSPPQNPVSGQIWFDKSPGINALKVYINDTTGWKPLNFTADLSTSTINDDVSFLGTVTVFDDFTVSTGTSTFSDTVIFDTINVNFQDAKIIGNPVFEVLTQFNDTVVFNGPVTYNDTFTFNSTLTLDGPVTLSSSLTLVGAGSISIPSGTTMSLAGIGTVSSSGQLVFTGTSSILMQTGTNITFQTDSYLELGLRTSAPAAPSSATRHYTLNSGGNDSTTLVLFSFAGSHGSTTITDRAAGIIANGGTEPNNVVAVSGQAAIDKYVRKFGSGSLKLDGTSDYLTITDNTNFDFGVGEFTVDCWIKPNAIGAAQTIFSKGTTASDRFELILTAAGLIQFLFNDGSNSIDISGGTVPADTWTHVVIERINPDSTSDFNVYIDGNRVATTNVTGATYAFNVITGNFEIGRRVYGSFEYFDGYLENFRLVKGTGKYDGGFQPRSVNIDINIPVFESNNGIFVPVQGEISNTTFDW